MVMVGVSGFLPTGAVAELMRRIEVGMTSASAQVLYADGIEEGPGGEDVTSYAERLTSPCAIRPAASPQATVTAGAPDVADKYEVKFPAGTDVRAADLLIVSHALPGVPTPLTLSVTAPRRKTFELSRRVVAELL